MSTTFESTTSATTRTTRRFRYVALAEDGGKRRGTIEALSYRGARSSLRAEGLDPVKLKERTGLNLELTAPRVKQVDLMHFSRQLAAFVRAGIPILEAIQSLADGMDNSTFRNALLELNDALRAGEPLTAAMAEHPKVFPPYYTTAIRAAESTGNLDATLDRLAEYLERGVENQRKVRSALAYPGVIMVFAIIVVVILTTFVIPRFQSFFETLGGQLPLPTRMLIGTMDFLVQYWWVLVLALILVLILAGPVARTTRGRAIRDTIVIKLPAVGPLVRIAIIERFCRALGSMTEAAVPLPEAVEIAAEGTNNHVFTTRIMEAREQMLQGAGIARPIEQTELFPPAATQMMFAGEETGTLGRQLMNAANFFEKELDYRLNRFTTLFEPAVILVAGVIVGFVAIALVSAMYGLITEINL